MTNTIEPFFIYFFFILESNEVPEWNEVDRNYLAFRRRYLEKTRDSLRSRFWKENLAELVQSAHRSSLRPGHIVYISSDNVKLLNWKCFKCHFSVYAKETLISPQCWTRLTITLFISLKQNWLFFILYRSKEVKILWKKFSLEGISLYTKK